MKRFPVAFFIQDLGGGGAEKITVRLANALAQKGYDVDLIRQSAEGVYIKDIRPNVHSIVIETRSPLKAMIFLYRYLKRIRPSVFFTIMEKPSLLGIPAAMLARYRNVIPCIHTDINSYVMLDHGFRRKVLRILVAIFYRFAATTIAVSDGAGAALRRVVGSSVPVEVVYNGFDLEDLRKESQTPITLPFSENKDIPVFIACGRMVPQKNFDMLLRAFAQVRRDIPSRLIILGDGPLKERLAALGHELSIGDDVYFPGFVSIPTAWFARGDVFVLSSRVEGFGNVLVEALVSGLNVVSTDCPSGPAEILQSGKYGQLVTVNDIDALANAMKSELACRQDRKAFDASVQAYLQDRFSTESMVGGYLRVANIGAIGSAL